MNQKSPFAGSAFKNAIQAQGDKILQDLRENQEDARVNPMDPKVKRDYNFIIVMRHSRRIDQHPKFAPHLQWEEKDEYERCFDPPLCDFQLPIDKINEVIEFIPTLNITKIVISPFLRCIQTATVIARHLGVTHFEIDARIGEIAPAIDRCIRHATNKKEANEDIQYSIPESYKSIEYLSMESIKKIIQELYGKKEIADSALNVEDVNNEKDGDEKKEAIEVQDSEEVEFVIDWKHKEKPGNHQYLECVKEYREIIVKEYNAKGKKEYDECRDILMITHGQIVSDISSDLCGKVLTVDECGWFAINHNEVMKLYSPDSVRVILDQNDL